MKCNKYNKTEKAYKYNFQIINPNICYRYQIKLFPLNCDICYSVHNYYHEINLILLHFIENSLT